MTDHNELFVAIASSLKLNIYVDISVCAGRRWRPGLNLEGTGFASLGLPMELYDSVTLNYASVFSPNSPLIEE
jgi:hypothetical protein